MSGEAPKRRLQLGLHLEADDLDSLTQALEQIALDLHIARRETSTRTSGGWSVGYHLKLTCDPDQTGDRYREQLETYTLAKRDEGGAGYAG